MKSWPTCGREGGKKSDGGEIETARGCDIKTSSRWWMSTSATLARTTKRQLCNGRQVISRIVYSWEGVGASGTSLWVNVCRVFDLQGNELWSRSVTEDDCAACPSWEMGLHLLRPHSFQLTVHIKHIYIRIKMELEPGKRCNRHCWTMSLLPVIRRCLIVTASGLMGQNRPAKR